MTRALLATSSKLYNFRCFQIPSVGRVHYDVIDSYSTTVFSVLEATESGHARLDPGLLIGAPRIINEVRAVGGQVYPHDKVCRMSRCRQGSSSGQHLLRGTNKRAYP